MAVFSVTCITINHRVFIKHFSNPRGQMHIGTHIYTSIRNPNFPLKFSLIPSISMHYFSFSHSFFLSPLGHQNHLEYFWSRVSVLKYIPNVNWCLFKSYMHCVLIRRQFQFSQEHSNLKEVSHFVLWHEKKMIVMIPIKRCESHFYIFVLF